MARTPQNETQAARDGRAEVEDMSTQLLTETEAQRTAPLQPDQEGDTEALLRALIAITRRLASEQQTVVESSGAGELAA